MEYDSQEKQIIIDKYLRQYAIDFDHSILSSIAAKVSAVPREIHNLCIKIRDFVITHGAHVEMYHTATNNQTNSQHSITASMWDAFLTHSKIEEGGTTPLHAKYLEILRNADRPLGVKTIAVQLGINEKAVEEDVEPLLLKLGKIEKTAGGRIII